MSDLASKIIREMLRREPTNEDYRRVNDMLGALPGEIRSSPAAMYELVLRMEFLRQMEEAIAKAGREAQQRIHHDLPGRIDQAALSALRKVRDSLPMDAAHSARKLYQATAIVTLFFGTMCGAGGWILGAKFVEKARAATHAASDREFGRCVDAATGSFVTSHRSGVRSAPISYDTVRNDLMICSAEYADRRADSG